MILVVGDVMTDVIVRPAGKLARGTDCPAAIETRPGGSAANIACWIGHLGGAVAFAGRVGHADAAAQRAALQAHAVAARLAVDDAAPTGSIVAIVEPDGERSFYTDRGANRFLCAADLPETLLDGVGALHVSGHALLEPGPRAAALALMRAARGRGCRVSVDAGSVAWLEAVGPAAFAGWAGDAGTCFANAAEAALLQPAWRGETLVVTDGANGAYATAAGATLHVAASAVAVVDGIGAGDAFVAGFLCAQTRDYDLREWLLAGARTATEAVLTFGGRPNLTGHVPAATKCDVARQVMR